jgi:hypothetical protein
MRLGFIFNKIRKTMGNIETKKMFGSIDVFILQRYKENYGYQIWHFYNNFSMNEALAFLKHYDNAEIAAFKNNFIVKHTVYMYISY